MVAIRTSPSCSSWRGLVGGTDVEPGIRSGPEQGRDAAPHALFPCHQGSITEFVAGVIEREVHVVGHEPGPVDGHRRLDGGEERFPGRLDASCYDPDRPPRHT